MTLISKLISSENTSLQSLFSSKTRTFLGKIDPKLPTMEKNATLLKMVSLLLENFYFPKNCEDTDKNKPKQKGYCVYNCSITPAISVENYLTRVQTYSKFSDEMLLLALVYIDKLVQKTGLQISGQNIHKLILTSLTLSCKFLDDDWENNDFMSKLGGIPLAELNFMESLFLKDLNFELVVDYKTLLFYQKHIRDYYCTRLVHNSCSQNTPSIVI